MMAKALGDSVAVMDNGRVVHRGRMAELAADESPAAAPAGPVAGSAPMNTARVSGPRRPAGGRPRRVRGHPEGPFDWKPVALLAALMAAGLPAIGSGSTWLTLTVAGLAMGSSSSSSPRA
jgi:hypothetical protein